MAESLTQEQPLVDAAARERRPASAHRLRFALAYAGLAVAFWAAIAVLAVVLARGGPAPEAAWSTWRPSARLAIDRAGQIAAYVAPHYRLPDSSQLVGVQARVPEVLTQSQRIPVAAVVTSAGISGQDIHVDSTEKTVFFSFLGTGPNATVVGNPTVERGTLVRREALEIALYTFKYAGADAVVVFLPPSKVLSDAGQPVDVSPAMYLRSADLKEQLSRPLAETLPRHQPLDPASLPPAERRLVGRLTGPHVFKSTFAPGPNGGAVLELSGLTSPQ